MKTSTAIINKLNQEIVRLLNDPEAKERFSGLAMQIIGGTPEALGVALKNDIATLGKLIRDLNIKSD